MNGGRHVIVEVQPRGAGEVEQRWRDVLVCQHLALQTLADNGISAAPAKVIEAGSRVFLEVARFDRTSKGRVGMVSLLAYDGEYIGQMHN